MHATSVGIKIVIVLFVVTWVVIHKFVITREELSSLYIHVPIGIIQSSI